ncbi:hypothetical protein SRHO_G00054880 [Serrasalmus rhombeus]
MSNEKPSRFRLNVMRRAYKRLQQEAFEAASLDECARQAAKLVQPISSTYTDGPVAHSISAVSCNDADLLQVVCELSETVKDLSKDLAAWKMKQRNDDVIVTHNIDAAGAQQKLYFDRQMRYTAYEPGGLVWVDCPALARQRLSPKWMGPYKVLRQLDSPNGDIGVIMSSKINWIYGLNLR